MFSRAIRSMFIGLVVIGATGRVNALLSLGESVNATNLTWQSVGLGSSEWYAQTTNQHDGVAAAQSGSISNNQWSVLQTTVTGPGTLQFWWKVSSEQDRDWLSVLVGSETSTIGNRISGEKEWEQKTIAILASGTTTVRWVYSKDNEFFSGSDCGWIDQVTFTAYPNTVTVVFDPQGGTVSQPWGAYQIGKSYDVLPLPSRSGYNFAGWYTQPNGTGNVITVSTIVQAEVTGLYATWTLRPAQYWYVDASRTNDLGAGTNWTTACQSIQTAIDKATDGDRVIVTNGVYATGSTNINATGNSRIAITKQILVQSVNGASYTRIQGSGTNTYPSSAAIRCVYLSAGVLEGMTLENGTTGSSGDVYYNYGGAVLAPTSSIARVVGCVIQNSKAYRGGGAGYGTFLNCVFKGNVSVNSGGGAYGSVMTNCLVVGNAAAGTGYYGGGAYSGTLINCTVVTNSASAAGGVYNANVVNCIVWGNKANSGDANCAGVLMSIRYSCTTLAGGEANITSNPLFVDAANANYMLSTNSPCRDAGTNSANTASTDLEGNARIYNERIDMGAYEWMPPPLTETQTTPVHVPFSWLDLYYAGLSAVEQYEATAGGTGENQYKVWESYVAGLVPTNFYSRLTASIILTNDCPLISWTPDLGSARVYTVEGKNHFLDASWNSPSNAASLFFRVKVSMP